MFNRQHIIGCCLGMVLVVAASAHAQRQRFPRSGVSVPPAQGTVTANPLTPVMQNAPSTTLGPPSFDPYSTTPNAASTPPSLLGPQPTSPSAAPQTTPFWQAPATQQPAVTPSYPAPGAYPQGTYPYGTYTPQPSVLFPNGLNMPGWSAPNGQAGEYLRLFQDVRMTYTWVYGNNGSQKMTTNDVDVGTTMNIPNFFFSGQPLRTSPVFIFHFWDGPDTTLDTPAMPFPAAGTVASGAFPTELPSRVYSTYVDFAWDPVITPQLGADLEVSVGVYSDFDTFTTDSVRFRGTGLFVLGLTPTVALKGGVAYLDRLDVKLLPAGGILWRPNPQTHFDIYFPKPKLAQYLYTVGNTDVWWYLMGEYGGGSWTMNRNQILNDGAGGFTAAQIGGDKRVDINDIRVGGGLEWTHQFGLTGFFEVAYVFNRELVFAAGVPGSHKLKDTIMLRGGLTY